VIYDEGLRSYKAIVFIQSKNRQTPISSLLFSYLELGAILQRNFLSQKQKNLRILPKNLGETYYG